MNYNLASERVRKGWTQADLAELLGCTVKTVSTWERDISNMPGESLRIAASEFNCSIDYLMDETEERTVKKN